MGIWGGLAQCWLLLLWDHSMWTLESSLRQAQIVWWPQGYWRLLESFHYLLPSDPSCFRVDLHSGEGRKKKCFLGFQQLHYFFQGIPFLVLGERWLLFTVHWGGHVEASNWLSCPPALLNGNLGFKYCHFCYGWEIKGCWACFLTKHLKVIVSKSLLSFPLL